METSFPPGKIDDTILAKLMLVTDVEDRLQKYVCHKPSTNMMSNIPKSTNIMRLSVTIVSDNLSLKS